MKKKLLIIIGLLFLVNITIDASNRYWVGGTGAWNDQSHWSALSGGAGGASVPTFNDDVFFDENSVDNETLSINILGLAQSRDLIFSGNLGTSNLVGSSAARLEIYGSLAFSAYVENNFQGEISFLGSGAKNIDFKNAMPKGNVRFSGDNNTIWNLNSNLFLSFYAKIIIEGGRVNAQNSLMQAHGIQWVGATNKELNISNSQLVLVQPIDETGTANSAVIKNNTKLYPRHTGSSRAIDSIQYVVVSPLCNTSCDGTITVTVFAAAGTGPFSYVWTGGNCSPSCSGNPVTGRCAGSYLLSLTDASDGETTQQFITVLAPNPIGVTFVKKKPKCFGQCNGSLTANITVGSGTAPYTYSWNTTPVQTTQVATNLCVGSYTLTVKDAHNCSQTFPVTLTQPTVVNTNITSTDITCAGVCNGTASTAPTGGNTGTLYTYNWTSSTLPGFSSSAQSVSSLCAGTYNVTVKDDSLCSAVSSVTITAPPPLVIAPSSTNVTCNGLNNGTASVAPVSGGNPPYTYTWTPAAGNVPSLSNLAPGAYSVIVTDATGCTKNANFNITQPGPLTSSIVGTNVNCFNACNGSAVLTINGGTPPFTIVWTKTLPGGITGQSTTNISALCPDTYTATITDSKGCTSVSTVTITEPPVLAANPVATNIACFGQCNGSITSTPTGGTPPYSYLWTSALFPPAPVGQNTATISSLCQGIYTVRVTDFKGCISTQNATISQPPLLVPNATFTNVSCNAACNGDATATPTGGTAPYTYSWTGPAPFAGSTNQSISGLCPGIYTVTVTDANLCTKNQSVTITQPNPLNVTLNATALLCNGDCNSTITSTVSGGTPPYNFAWSTGSSASSLTNRCAGNYSLTVTDAKGCSKTVPITVNQPTLLTAAPSSTDVTCFGLCNGVASVIAGGGTPGYTYLWTPGNQTTSSITNKCAGTYTIRVKDLNGCTITNTVDINEPAQLTVTPSIVTPISCAGACDGSVTAVYAGGNPPVTSSWLPGVYAGEPAPTITNLCAGTYTNVGTDSKGCTASAPITLTQPTAITAPITGSTSSCNICNGTATVTPSGGTPSVPGPNGYTYLWSANAMSQTTQTATGLCPNVTYTVTVRDSKGCTAISTVTISQTIAITITTSNTTLSCVGACDGIATANAAGGLAPYVFQWNNVTVPPSTLVGVTQTITNLCPGTYEVIVTDANGCLNKDSVTFTNPPAFSVSLTQTNLTCGGTCTGTATATPAGGTGAYTYLWSPSGQTTQTATNLCLGTYTLTVTDSSGCTITDSAVFAQPTVVIDNPTFTQTNCNQSIGAISVTASGGTPATVGAPYTYLWSGPAGFVGQGTSSITGLIAGAYDLTITDSVGCQFNFSYLISDQNGPTLSMAHTDISCNNLCDGSATVTAIGGAPGYTFDWTPNATGDGTNAITALCGTTTYTVQVTDIAGCIVFDSARVINPLIISANPVVVNETCGGLCNGSITLSPSGGTPGATGYTYSWSGGLPPTATQTGLCAGPYTVTITDANLCNVIIVINITAPPVLSVSIASTNVKCSGACNGTAIATPSGGSGFGYTYTWNPVVGVLANVVNLCPNTYTVTVKDGNNCTATASTTITEPLPLLSSTTQTNASCNGVCDGEAIVTPTGGTIPYSYNWMPGSINNDTASGLCAGNHDVTVTDFNGCISTPSTVIITEPAPILPNATFTNAKCFGSCNGTATAAPTGGSGVYTYSWNTVPVQNTSTATGLCAGTYIVTVDDGNCVATQSVTLVDPPILISSPTSTSPTCRNDCDGTVSASQLGGTPGYTYEWLPSHIVAPTVTNLCPGVYTLVVTDNNLCKDTSTVVMINPLSINIAISSTPAACNVPDGTITVSPTTGVAPYTFAWTIGGVTPPAPFTGDGTGNVTNVAAGLYSVLVTDANGCDSTFLIPLNNSSGPTGETVTTIDVTCFGLCNGSGSVTPIGGVPPYNYLWNDPIADTTFTANNLCAGTYQVEVTDSNTCIHFSPVTINQPNPISSGASITSAVCSNICTGAITLTPSGGTAPFSNYVWSPGNPTGQNSNAVSNLCSGTYTVSYNDANLCPKIDSFVVNQSTPLNAIIASTNSSCSNACNDTAYVVITSGTAPFTIQWDDPSGQTNDTATSLCAGTYSVKITDALGCITVLTTTITATPPVVLNATITNATCGICDGSAIAAPTGGTSPYTFMWSNGDSVANATNLCSGLYTVNVTDSAGCVSNFGVTVSNVSGPTSLAISSTDVTCNGLCNGSVTATTPTGGVAPYTYLWIQGGQTTSTLNNLCAGVYYVQVTDALGCSIVDSVTINGPVPIMANQVITAATCGANDGSITLNPTGCTGPISIFWVAGGQITPTLSGLSAGVYSVNLTCSTSGCTQNFQIPLNNQNAPTISVSSTNVSCNGAANGTATVSSSSSTIGATVWNDALFQMTATATGLSPGPYAVTVTDNNGCVAVGMVTITEPSPIGFSVTNTIDPQCNGDLNGSITVIPSGGTLPYTYVWSPAPAAGQITATASGLNANTYNVTVTDGNGCLGAIQTVTLTQTSVLKIDTAIVTNPSCNTIPDGAIDITVSGGALPYTYQWTGTTSATTEDLTNIFSGSDTIVVTDNNGCTVSDTIIVLPNQTVTANAGNDTTFCQSGTLTISAAASVNALNYQWYDMANVLLGSTSTLTFNPPTGTNSYYVVVDNGGTCSDNDTIVVTSNTLPGANAGADVIIVVGASTTIGGNPTGPAGSTFAWTPLPGLDNSALANPVATPASTTTYTVSVSSAQGCISTDVVTVTVLPTIIIPDGISPNGDGDNDEWILDGIELFPNCSVEVYNRWGELLFQSNGYKEHWKGVFNGKPLPVGTYYYIIDLKDPLFPDAYTGPITILR